MQAGGLGADQDRRDPGGVVRAVQVDVDDLRPELGEHVRGGLRVRGDGGVDVLEEEPARQADAQAGDPVVEAAPRLVERVVDGVRVVAVVAGDRREHLGDVRDVRAIGPMVSSAALTGNVPRLLTPARRWDAARSRR